MIYKISEADTQAALLRNSVFGFRITESCTFQVCAHTKVVLYEILHV